MVAKRLRLDASYRPLCLKYLSLGHSLGPPLLERVKEFAELSVWLPDACSVPPSVEDIPHRIPGHWEQFGLEQALAEFFDGFLAGREGALIVAETASRIGDPSWPPRQEGLIRWFSCAAPPGGREGSRDRVCVFLTTADASAENYSILRGHANYAPIVIVLTSLKPPTEIQSGERLDPGSQRWDDLLDRAEQILIGVCDDMSFIVMSRYEPPDL